MRVWSHTVLGQTVVCLLSFVGLAAAIEVNPTPTRIQLALDRGKQAAAEHRSPETLSRRFGGVDSVQGEGVLLTKLGSLSVLAAHMALRGLEPSADDIAQVIEASTMLVSATIVGERPDFAVNCYMVLDQGGRTIKPLTLRADGQANRRTTSPESEKFHAKIVATFRYNDFDPNARTMIMIFPASGGEVRFLVDFSHIE